MKFAGPDISLGLFALFTRMGEVMTRLKLLMSWSGALTAKSPCRVGCVMDGEVSSSRRLDAFVKAVAALWTIGFCCGDSVAVLCCNASKKLFAS